MRFRAFMLASIVAVAAAVQQPRLSAQTSAPDWAKLQTETLQHFQALLRLLREYRCWVKLSHAYHISVAGPPYQDTISLARTLIAVAPDRLLWGSDWPHPMLHGPMPNDGSLIDLLAAWVPDEERRHGVLVDNPARLYGFP